MKIGMVNFNFTIDKNIKDIFIKTAKCKNRSAASLLKDFIESYNKEFRDELIEKSQARMFN